jgi:hypothetical protein
LEDSRAASEKCVCTKVGQDRQRPVRCIANPKFVLHFSGCFHVCHRWVVSELRGCAECQAHEQANDHVVILRKISWDIYKERDDFTFKTSKTSETNTADRQQNHTLISVFSIVIPNAKRREGSLRII